MHANARNKALAICAAASVALVPLAAGTGAQAHVFAAPSRVSIHYSKPIFYGRVHSPRPRCERNRHVLLFKRRPGEDRLIGKDVTDDRGVWRVLRRHPHGDFYADVKSRRRSRYSHRHICLGDRSRTITRPSS